MDINAMVLIGLGLFRSFQKISSAPLVYDLVVANLSIGATHLPAKPHPDNHHPLLYSWRSDWNP